MSLKVGIVGMRGIGVPHAKAYEKDSLADFVAVCDLDPERAADASTKYGVRPYTSLQAMLVGEPELDIVDICTGGAENGGWHYIPAMEAMRAGKHVLVEKPLSNNIEEAREMVALAAEKQVYLGCNLNHYFTQPAERAMQYIREGQIGELIYCMMKMGFPGGEVENYVAPTGPEAKGFPYFHLKAFLSHPLSVMRHFCGDITGVQAFLKTPQFRSAAGDVMLTTNSIHLEFEHGMGGYLHSQRGDATYGMGGWWSIEVGGTRGTFCIENAVEKISYWKAGAPADPEVTTFPGVNFDVTFNNRIHAFAEDITGKVPMDQLRASGRDALAALECTFAIIKSYENAGTMVRPHPLPSNGV